MNLVWAPKVAGKTFPVNCIRSGSAVAATALISPQRVSRKFRLATQTSRVSGRRTAPAEMN